MLTPPTLYSTLRPEPLSRPYTAQFTTHSGKGERIDIFTQAYKMYEVYEGVLFYLNFTDL